MIEELKQLGLSNYESKIISLLVGERLDIRELSKKAKIPFGKIYSIIKSLKNKGIVRETKTRPKLVYMDCASDIISKLIEDKQKKDSIIFEKARYFVASLANSRNESNKFFEIGISNEDNKRIQLRSFTEAKDEVLQIINIHHKPKSNRENKTIWEKEICKAIKRGVIFRSIYPVSAILPDILKKLNDKNKEEFQVRRLDTNFVRCDIIDRKRVMIKLVQQDPLQFGGILFIENERLAENLIKIFNELWEHATS